MTLALLLATQLVPGVLYRGIAEHQTLGQDRAPALSVGWLSLGAEIVAAWDL